MKLRPPLLWSLANTGICTLEVEPEEIMRCSEGRPGGESATTFWRQWEAAFRWLGGVIGKEDLSCTP